MEKQQEPGAARPVFSPARALQPIDSSKLMPPRSTARIVARERLLEQLLEARRRRCIVLKGPAGWGKTTVLLSWRQKLISFGFDVAWLTLTQDDNDLTRFLDYLLASLAHLSPEIVRDASLLEGSGIDREGIERTVVTLVRGIASHPREVVLVLDDLHALTDTAIHEALQWLLDYAPANLHLVLASRSSVPLSLARLRSQDLALELNLRDLRFTPEESEQFLKAQLGDIDARDARLLHDLSDGWIAGLQLLSVSRKKGKAAIQSPVQLRDTEAFASFFESEVLSHLSVEDVELLLHMAVCNRFCASLCAALTGRAESESAVAVLLARLESDNLFLIPIDSADPGTWYRLHPLLRENLLKHFESLSEEEQRSVHARAWVWFREHDHLDEAVRHAVAGGEAEAATRLVERRMQALYAQGDLRVLVELIRQLPVEQVRKHIGLRIVQARMHIYAREFAACIECVEQMERDIPLDHREDRFRLALVRALLAIQRDDTDSALALLPELMDPPKGIDAASVGGSINLRSWLCMHRGDYEEARRIQVERPPLMINGVPLLGTAGGTLQGRCLVGLSYAMQGRMNQAERVYREVLHEAERGGKACAESMYMAIALLGEVLYEMNDVEAAHKLLADRIDTLERISIPDSVLRVIEVLWKAEWRIGNRLESSAYMERLEEYATKLGLDRLLAYSLTWQFLWSLLQGERADAEARLERLNDLDARHPHAEGSALKEIYLLAETCRVRWQASQGDLKGAARRLERLIERSEGTGRQLGTARLLMLGAVFDKQLGQLDAARAKVIEVLRWGHRLGLLRSLLDIHPAAASLIEEVTRSEALDPVLAFYVERLLATQQPVPAAAQAPAPADPRARKPLAASVEPLKERELEILHLLAQALPNKKIARTLGLSPETVKWHLSHIYSKLGVSSRDEAVARMRDLETGLEE